MASVGTYVNFAGNAEEALAFYCELFGTELLDLQRFGDMPGQEFPEHIQSKVLHASFHLYGHLIQATDMIEELGHHLRIGNNTTIALELDSRAECDRLYAALAEGGGEGSGMIEQFWGYWGSVQDRFGIRWMFNHMN